MENRAIKVESVSEVALKRGEARRTSILKSKLRLGSVRLQYRDALGHLIDFSSHVFRSRAAPVPASGESAVTPLGRKNDWQGRSGFLLTSKSNDHSLNKTLDSIEHQIEARSKS